MSAAAEPEVTDATRRAAALRRAGALEDLPDESLRLVVRLAAHLAGGDGVSAAVHLLDESFQHRVAAADAAIGRFPVADSLCVHAVEGGEPLHLPDPAGDPRFAGNPWTSGSDAMRMYYGAPLRVNGQAVGTVCVFSSVPRELSEEQRSRLKDLADLTGTQLELRALARELGHDAAHDPLTGLPNRVFLSHRLSAALARAERGQAAPALLLLDLDRFKQVNDAHGHAVGDEVLVSTATRLRAAVREEDVVARFGGDEFAVLVDDVGDASVLVDLLSRLRAAAAQPHETSVGELRCAFTIGRARARPGDLPYELLGRCDADLYLSKPATGQAVELP